MGGNARIRISSFVLRFLYTLILYLGTPLLLAHAGWTGWRNPAHWRRLPERFGFSTAVPQAGNTVWLHAASVGEVEAAIPLIQAVRERYPTLPLVITTMTPTGAQHAEQRLEGQAVHRFLPYDLPSAVDRFLKRVGPRLALVMETELWPNLFEACGRQGVPIILVNARMSERSVVGYRRVAELTRATLSKVRAVAAQSRLDADRFISLGVEPSKVTVAGSIKFDTRLPKGLTEKAASLRRFLGIDRPVWIAASTHNNEETMILDAFEHVLAVHPSCLLIIAPRHRERFARVATLCKKRGFNTVRASDDKDYDPHTQVFIVDALGDLPMYYAVSDIAFVGGSLVPRGGHNMLEPASLGVPVVMGPHLSNFEEISGWLLGVGAAWVVNDVGELASKVLSLLADSSLRQRTGEMGRRVVDEHRGSVERIMTLLSPYLTA